MITLDPAQVEALRREAEARSGEPAPDMLSWHFLWLAPDADVDAALQALRARQEVEAVYVSSTIVPPPPGLP